MRPRTGLAVAAVATLGVLAVAVPAMAAASVTPPCTGTVTFPDPGGGEDEEWSSASGEALVVPQGVDVVEWTGTTGTTVITDHRGEIGVVVGPTTIPLGDWRGENAESETSASGDYDVDDLRAELPFELVGIYEVKGSHSGEGGSCTGLVTVVIEGNPLSTVLGLGGLAAAVIGAGGLVAAGAGTAASNAAAAAGSSPSDPGAAERGTEGS